MDRRRLIPAVLVCMFFATGMWSATGVCHATPITYDFVNYPVDQDEHTLSGTITTDGTLGFLSAGNILSYSVSVAGTHPQSWTSGDLGVDVAFSSGDSLEAFADRLVFDASNTGGGSPRGFSVSFNDPANPGGLFRTLRYRSAFSSVTPIYEATNSVSPPASWSTISPYMNLYADVPTDWVIACVAGCPTFRPADANGDSFVDGLDYLIWAHNFGADPAPDPPGSPENGDYNNDGKVNGIDYLFWAQFYTGSGGVTAVPEPGTAMLLVLGTAMLLSRRHRRIS